jgi:hypothetical protein
MARNIECTCDASFTCGFCLRNAKPYFFTPRTNEEIMHAKIHADFILAEASKQTERKETA